MVVNCLPDGLHMLESIRRKIVATTKNIHKIIEQKSGLSYIKKGLLWIVKLRLSWIVSIICTSKFLQNITLVIAQCNKHAGLGQIRESYTCLITHHIEVSWEQTY